ncbi:hypothetical protein [Candidatus Methylocalor cossyra]|uniref:Eukaryotic translation initiation factor 3 110 kDa subunit n=1 Tax=Candidatus Methylocalor cossyra TaxID=3108543 RepID=A0ABM9NEI2_9GAMM
MTLSNDDVQFLEQMVRQLEETIRELSEREQGLMRALGAERTAQLRELWASQLGREEELELRRSLDWRDRELLWMWARLKRARSARVEAGQAIMRRARLPSSASEPGP